MTSNEMQFDLVITEVDADPDRLDDLTRYLMRDLRDLGVESVKRLPGEVAPPHAKGIGSDSMTLGVVAAPSFLPNVFGLLQSWSRRAPDRKIKITMPDGTIVEFTAEKELSPAELAAYVKTLTGGAKGSAVETLTGGAQVGDVDLERRGLEPRYRNRVRQFLSAHFDTEELRTLCFDLGVEYDDLPGEGRAGKVRELLRYIERHERIHDLLKVGKELNPDLAWERISEVVEQIPER